MEDNRILKLTGLLDQRKTQKQINSDLKKLEHVISMLRVTTAFTAGDTKEQLNSFLEQAQAQIDHANLKLKVDTGHLNNEIGQALHNVSFQDMNLLNIDESKIMLKLEKIVADIRTLVNRSPIPVNLGVRTEGLSKKLDSYMSKNSKIGTSSVLRDEADKVRNLINSVTDKQSFADADNALKLFQSTVRATGFETANALDKIKAMASQAKTILGVFGLASSAVENFSKSLKTLKANDSILAQISRTSQLTKPQLEEINDRSFQVAGRYGQSSGDYLRTVQDMSLAGYQDPGGMAQLSTAVQSAGNMTADLAEKYLIATDKAFGMKGAVSVLTAALDGANHIAARHSLSMSDLAEAMSLAGAQAADSGLKVNETAAALSAMMSITQQGGSQAAGALKSLLMNLSQVTGEVTETGASIDSESLERYRKACADLGVSLTTVRNGAVSLKEPMGIIRELSAAYMSLAPSDTRRSNLLESTGSQAGAEALKALLENYSLYEEMLRDYADGMGSLDQEAAKAASSWEGRLNSLQNSWDSFVNTLTNKELILNGISFFDRLIRGAEALADTIGEIPVMITAVNAAMVMKNKDYGIKSLINTETKKIDIQGNIFGVDFTAIKEMKKHFSEAENAIASWNDELSDGQTDLNLFKHDTIQSNAELKNYLSTCSKEAPGSIEGYKAYLQAAGKTTDVLRLKTLLLTSAVSMGLGLALQAAVTLINNYIHRIEQADHALSNSVSAYQTAQSELSSINSELETQSRLMDELLAKDDLTGSEKDRLKDLQAITRELELQKALKEEEVRREARDVAQKVVEAYETRHNAPVSDNLINANYGSLQETGMNASVLNNAENINQQIASYRILREEQQKALSGQSEGYEDIAAKTQIIEDNLYQQLEITEEYRKQLMALPYDELTQKQKQVLDQLNNDRKFLWKELDPGKWNDYQMESVFDQNDLKMTKQQLMELVKAGELDEDFILSNSDLMEALSKLDLFLEDGVTNTQAFIHYMKALGELTPDIPASSSLESPDFSTSSITQVVETLKDMEGQWKTLNGLYDEFLAKGTGHFSNGAMAAAVEAFKGMDGIHLDRFLSVLSDSASTADEVQGAFNQLATEYLFASGCLEGLTDATAEQAVKELEAQGIANASSTIYNYLAASKEFSALTGKDLASATQEEIYAFLNEASASDAARTYIAQLELAKLAVNGAKINTSSDIDQVIALANAAGASAMVLGKLEKARDIYSRFEAKAKDGLTPLNPLELHKTALELEEVKDELDRIRNGTFDWKLDPSLFKPLDYGGIASPPVSAASTPSAAPQLEQEKQEKQATIETIDWLQRKSDALKDQHDLLSRLAEDETASYDKRVQALTQLIEMDKERASAAKQAAGSYREAWKDAIKDLQYQDIARIMVGLSDQAVTDILEGLPQEEINQILEFLHREDITKLMNENLNAEEYSSEVYGKDYLDNLKKAIDFWDQIEDKLKETDEIEQDSLEHTREQIRLQGELIDAQQELLSLELESARAKLDMAEASGEAVTKSMYRDMISGSQDLADSYRDRIDYLEEQLSEIDDEDSAQYQSLLAQIGQCERSIADCEKQQAEWNDAIKRIPIDRVSKYIAMLRNIKQDLQNFLDEQSAMGLEPSPEQLQQMMSLSEEEIKKLLEQQEKLQKLLPGYEYGSEKFEQTSQEIQDIDNQISSLIQSQLEYNEALLRMPVDQLQRQLDFLSNARSDLDNKIAEQEADGFGKTLEQYAALSSLSQARLQSLAAQKEMLTALLGVYDKDSSKYKETQDQIQGIEDSISSLIQEQAQWNQEILKIPVDQVSKYVDSVSEARSDLDNSIAVQEAGGVGKTLEQYQSLHDMSMRQMEALSRQRSVLLSVMGAYGEGSDGYQDAQSQLQSIEDSMASLIQEQAAWNDEILRIPIDKTQEYADSLSNARSDLENKISEQESKGIGRTLEQYRALQTISTQQLKNLSQRKEMLTALSGMYDKDSSQYLQIEGEIQGVQDSISSLVQEQEKWNQEILRIPIDKIESQSGALSNARKDLENSLSEQEAKGVGKSLEQYRALQSMSMDQLALLSRQKEMLTSLLTVYDEDSHIYRQTQDEIQGIEDNISSLIQEQSKWNQELLRIPIDRISGQYGSLSNARKDLENSLSEQEASGISKTLEQYQALHSMSMEQLQLLSRQKEMLTSLLGVYDKDSDIYKQTQGEIQGIEDSLSSLIQEQTKWNQEMLQIPIGKLEGYGSLLSNARSDLENSIAQQEAKGIGKTLGQYKALQSVSMEQIQNLNQQKEALAALLDVYDKDSSQYSDTLGRIQGIEDSLSSLIQEQENWNQEILRMPVDQMKEYSDSLDSVKSDLQSFLDAQSARGIGATVDQYQQLNAITLAQLGALKTRKEMLTQLLGQYDKNSDAYRTASDEIQEVNSAVQSLVRDQYEWNKAILQLPMDNISKVNEELNRCSSVFGDVLSDYGAALSAVNGVLDEQIDKINESRESSEKAYEDKIKPIQDELDLLKKQNDERSVQLALEQAAYDLDRAKNQKTTQVIRNGEIQYEADADALRQAGESKADAEYNKTVHDLEKQIDSLTEERDNLLDGYDAQIEQLEKIREKWSSITEEIKSASDMAKASEIFGSDDWKSKLLSGNDTDMYQAFQSTYQALSSQKEQAEKQIASNERIAEMMGIFVEQYQNGAFTYEEAMAHVSDLAKAMAGGYSAMEQLGSLMSLEGMSQLSQITGSSSEKISASMEALMEYMRTVKENNESVSGYASSWLETQAGIADRLAGLESLSVSAEAFKEYIETVKANQSDLSQYTNTWAAVSEDVKRQIEILKSLTGSFSDFQKYIDAVKNNQLDISPYIQSWDSVKDSVDGQVDAIRSAAETMEQFQEYLKMVKLNEDELARYTQSWGGVKDSVDRQVKALNDSSMSLDEFRKYLETVRAGSQDLSQFTQSWGSIKDSVDRQVEALDHSAMSLEEFQKYLETVRANRGDLSGYTQTWEAIKADVERQVSYLENMAGSFEDIQTFISTIQDNRESLKEYTETWKAVRDSVESQVSSLGSTEEAMDRFREHLETYQANAEGISKYTTTWEKLKESIAEQVEALRKAAEALDGARKGILGLTIKEILERYPGAYERGGLIRIPIGGEIEDDGRGWGSSGGSKSHNDEDDNGYVPYGPGAPEDPRNHSAQSYQILSATADAKLSNASALSLKPLTPEEFPIIAQNTALAGLAALASARTQPQNTVSLSFGDINVQGVQDPDGFAKALHNRIELSLGQNFSKIFR